MKARRLIVVSVIGAAAVGGALTGTTSASFRGSTGLETPPLRTGSLQVSTSVPQQLGVIDQGSTGTAVVRIAPSGQGKNLTTITSIESVSVDASVALDLTFRQRQGSTDDCNGGPYTPWQDKGTGGASPVRVGAAGRPVTQDVCVKAVIAGGSQSTPVGRHPVSVTLGVATRQARDEETFGWAAEDQAAISGEVLVRPAAPSAACTAGPGAKPDLRFDWEPVTGADEYRLYRVDGPGPTLLGRAGAASRTLTVTHKSLGGDLEGSRYLLRAAHADDESLGGGEHTLSYTKRNGWRC